eukprot:TRINITY_DN221162_c7_g1_i1.p1 TRINITY_DN221162_c7_g1~~TRINITY_DN221162_c7_g1_i1.p1  ORF type:complete len:103 (-),score=12.40 TRINITY_DN221162_c7_g1_i1:481-789(-)
MLLFQPLFHERLLLMRLIRRKFFKDVLLDKFLFRKEEDFEILQGVDELATVVDSSVLAFEKNVKAKGMKYFIALWSAVAIGSFVAHQYYQRRKRKQRKEKKR